MSDDDLPIGYDKAVKAGLANRASQDSHTMQVGKGHGTNTPNLPVIREVLPENQTPEQRAFNAMLEPGTRVFRMGKVLSRLDVQFEAEVCLFTKASGRRKRAYIVDVIVWLNGGCFALEVDGAYWHSQPAQRRQDRLKNAFLKRRGIPLCRIPEDALDNGSASALISDFLGLSALAA